MFDGWGVARECGVGEPVDLRAVFCSPAVATGAAGRAGWGGARGWGALDPRVWKAGLSRRRVPGDPRQEVMTGEPSAVRPENSLGGFPVQVGMGTVREDRSDGELLRAVTDRDRDALRDLYDRHAPWLRARLLRRCSNESVVEEVVQDVFVVVWTKPGSWRGSGDVAAWIWGIGIRRLMSAVRPRRPLPFRLLLAQAAPSAEEEVLLAIEHGPLGAAIDELSPELRDVVRAVALDGLSSREAGRLLGVPAATVRTRMARARTQLQEALS